MLQGTSTAFRAIAFFEAAKGAVVLLAGAGLLSLVHQDLHGLAVKLIEHLHLNPASAYPRIFVDWAANLSDDRLKLLSAGALLYALLRLVEAYGLILKKSWAEFIAASSGSVYVPFEIHELVIKPTWHGAMLLTLNLLIVAIMLQALLQRRRTGSSEV